MHECLDSQKYQFAIADFSNTKNIRVRNPKLAMDTHPEQGELGTWLELNTYYVWAAIHYLDSSTDYREYIHPVGEIPPILGGFTVQSASESGSRSSWIFLGVAGLVFLGILALIALASQFLSL